MTKLQYEKTNTFAKNVADIIYYNKLCEGVNIKNKMQRKKYLILRIFDIIQSEGVTVVH